MIGVTFKFSLAFLASFVLLSFQINNKTIFSHLSEVVGPLGSDVQRSLQKSVKRTLSKSSEVGSEFFENATPKISDKIQSTRSSVNNGDEIILEKLEQADIKELDKVIHNN